MRVPYSSLLEQEQSKRTSELRTCEAPTAGGRKAATAPGRQETRENRRVPSVLPSGRLEPTPARRASQPHTNPTRRGRGRGRQSKPESLLSIPPSSSSSSLPNPRTRARDSLPPPRSSRTRYDSGNPPARALVGLRGRDWLMPPRLA